MSNTITFVCVGLYRKSVSEAFFRQIQAVYPKSQIIMITRPNEFKIFENLSCNPLLCIDENTVIPHIPFTKFKTICDDISAKTRIYKSYGWAWQQFLKLYACTLQCVPEKYVIVDMDFIILSKFPFFDGDNPIFNISVFAEKYDANHRYQPFVQNLLQQQSVDGKFISEYMPFNKDMCNAMIKHVETLHKTDFVTVCLQQHLYDADIMISEYVLYPSYVYNTYPNRFYTSRILYQRMGSDFYYNTVSPSVIKIFQHIWGVQAVAFEKWNVQKCVPKLHLLIAFLRERGRYYGRLPLSMPKVTTADDLFNAKYNKRLRRIHRFFSIFDYTCWHKKHMIVLFVLMGIILFILRL